MNIPTDEDEFRDYFIQNMSDAVENIAFDRVEPHPTRGGTVGIPDVSYGMMNPNAAMAKAIAFHNWIEFKWGRPGKPIEVRPAQIQWFRNRHKINGWPWLIWGSAKMWGMIPASRIATLKDNKISGAAAKGLSCATFTWDEDPWEGTIAYLLYWPKGSKEDVETN